MAKELRPTQISSTDASGAEKGVASNPVVIKNISADSYGNSGVVLRDTSGAEKGTATNPIATSSNSNNDLTDRSGTIAAGGTAQSLLSASTTRRGWRIMNIGTSVIWFNDVGGTAAANAAGSYPVYAGEIYESPITMNCKKAVSVYGATTGQLFSAAEW